MGSDIIKKRETVGAVASRLAEKAHLNKHSAIDQMRESLTNFDENIHLCIKENKDKFEGGFYLVALRRGDRILKNVNRTQYFACVWCPTPDYDQVVYRYEKNGESLKFMWVVPDRRTVNSMSANRLLVPPSEYALLDFVLKFEDGTLLKRAKELCGERADSNILEN